MVPPFLPQKVMIFSVIVLKNLFLVVVLQTTITTPTLSAFQAHRLSTVLVNSAAKNI